MSGEIGQYALLIEDLRTNKSEQDRLAVLVGALASVFQLTHIPTCRTLLERKAAQLRLLCDEEDKILLQLAELRKDPKNLK